MKYSDAEIRTYIREVIRETKKTVKVDTGLLKRSLRGDIIGRDKSIEFREMDYGVYNNNSQLIKNAEKIIPKDLKWKVVFENIDGEDTEIIGKSKTGRKISRKEIGSENISSKNIKALIASIRSRGEKKDDTTEGNRKRDRQTPK